MIVMANGGGLAFLNALLAQLLNTGSPGVIVAGLFTNNLTLTPGMTLSSFIEPTGGQFPGYARQSINGAGLWSSAYLNAGGFPESDKLALTIYTPSSIGTGCPIYGYFVYNTATTTVYWAELNPAGPTTIGLTLLPYIVQMSFQRSQFNPTGPG